MPNSAALFTDLFEWLAVDDVVITVVDVPAELKSGLKNNRIVGACKDRKNVTGLSWIITW